MNEHSEIRDIRKRNFYWIDNAVMDHYAPQIGLAALAIYNALARRANQHAQAWPGNADLRRLTGLSRYGVRKAIKKLETHELISVTQRPRQNGRWQTNVYTLLPVEIPQDDLGNHVAQGGGVGNSVAQGRQPSCPGVGNSVAQGRQDSCLGVGNSVAPNKTHKNKTQEQNTKEQQAATTNNPLPAAAADLLNEFSITTQSLNGHSLNVAAWLLYAKDKSHLKNPAGFAISQAVKKNEQPPDTFLEIVSIDVPLRDLKPAAKAEKAREQGLQGLEHMEREAMQTVSYEALNAIEELL
jgi:hypothetical protein